MKKFNRKSFLLILFFGIFILFSVVDNVYAFNFTYKNVKYYVDIDAKNLVDRFVQKKCININIAQKYLNALKKIKYENLSIEKKQIYNYLSYKFALYISKNQTVINNLVQTGSINQKYSYLALPDSQRTFVENLIAKTSGYIEVDDNYIFKKDGKEFLLNLNKFYIVDFSLPIKTYLTIPDLKNEIFFKKGQIYYISKGSYTLEQKQNIEDLKSKVKLFSEDDESVFFELIGDYYYAYTLFEYKYFEIPNDGLFLSQYPKIGDLSNTILLLKDNKYSIVVDFSQIKLFKKDVLDQINDKNKFLDTIGKDIYFYNKKNLENSIISIKKETLNLINQNQSKDDKIFAIYSWITKNIEYDSLSMNFIDGKINEDTFKTGVDNNVFTGIGAYENKIAVCNGFTKLFLYMLFFAGIEDTEIEIGEANVGNGKYFSHTWIKIGNYYYDPTWDYQNENSGFKWYKLSKEEMYKTRIKK